VVQGYFEGTNTGPFLGIPPSGIKVVTRRCEVVRFNDEGYATERWGVGAELKTLQTMRVIPKLGEVSEQSKAGTVAARFCEECFERSNPAAIADLVDERARADSKGMLELFEYVSALSDIKSRVRDAGEVGRSTAHVTLEMSGVHTGLGLGREPTKQPATMQMTVSARVSKGKIAHLWIDVAAADGRPT
jgi:hypothetical protein